METKGGCCIVRSPSYHMSKVDRIMLRFRPIAPKPLPSDAALPPPPKRRRATKRSSRRRKAVTLPLLPETPDPAPAPAPQPNNKDAPLWLSFGNRGVDPRWYQAPAGAAGSVVTVECVTDTWQEERRVKLGEDTCPGFISDGYGRVTWTNAAFKEAVGEGGVLLAMRMTVPDPYRGFTCRVRVQYACGKERTLPCDVWRMDTSGALAWRLDVNAALSLSLAL
ncbi:hypothetical protein VNO78_02382 [Psophocarpus tetragonolobus]|uniref:DUF7950 domain-containing protein n=1 Tax=Psophocarpus tetragonolobus TaxID=3891 RepID=A0AAN9SZW7_PSOTE